MTARGIILSSGTILMRAAWALVLLVCLVDCASPAAPTRDALMAGGEPPPRFATGGPDAEELGASMRYPKGTPATGLLIARGDTIFVERYQYGRTSLRHLLQMSSGVRFNERFPPRRHGS